MGHSKSLEAWKQRERERGHGCEQNLGQGQQRTCSNVNVVAQESPSAYSAIVLARVLVETRGSFSDCKSWVESAETAGSSTIVCDRKSAQKRVQALASFELGVTRTIASAACFSDWQRTGSNARARLRRRACLGRYLLSSGGWRRRNPWLEVVGGIQACGVRRDGPWPIDRRISVRALPDDMGTEGKARCHRSAKQCGEHRAAIMQCVGVALHTKLCNRTRCWASDGADRSVGMAATSTMPKMAFREWGEGHPAVTKA